MHNKKLPFSWRYWFLSGLISLAFLGIAWRLIDLTLFDHDFLQKQGDARSLRIIPLPAHRGMILDRHGEPLAISSPVLSVWVNPKTFNTSIPTLPALAQSLDLNTAQLQQKLSDNQQRSFLYLKRQLPPTVANKIKALQIPGIYFLEEYRRYYPEGETIAQLLGSTNVDDQGQEGIELSYNPWLEGVPGLKKVAKDRLGHVVDEFETLRAPKPGNALTLSIDKRIQYIAYHALQIGVEKYHAEAGSIIVIDPRNNEILALTNYPSFNPNLRTTPSADHRNRAVTDVFEPASTLKTFSVANALNSGKFQPYSQVDTAPGWISVEGKRVQDIHNKGLLTLTDVLKYSSNVGITKVTLSLPSNSLWTLLHKLGFGQLSDLQLPGERAGALENHFIWHPFTLATLSFGYGMNNTALQLAQAYAVIAHQGIKIPLSLTPVTEPQKATRVFDEKTARALLSMMQTVVEKDGTAPLARVPGYAVAGKTGTGKRVGAQGYLKHNYNSSFVGIVPAEHPHLLIAVVLYNLAGNVYYGGYTAGPIFAEVAGQTLHLLAIPPTEDSTPT